MKYAFGKGAPLYFLAEPFSVGLLYKGCNFGVQILGLLLSR